MPLPCPLCGVCHDTTACPPKRTNVAYTQAQEPVMVGNAPYKGTFSLTLTLTFIPNELLRDGQRVPAGNDSWFVSRAEYDRLAQADPSLILNLLLPKATTT
jgi:hypothetical protein